MTLPIRAVRPDRNRPEPLWHQTELAVRALIADGTWVDGAQLPNETRLGEMLGVSRITMRHALRNLEEWGLLRREQGRGTFVSSSTVIAGVRGPTSFTQEMADRGLTAASRVLELRAERADNAIASALEIREGAAVCKIRRLRSGGGQPIGIQTAFLPAKRVPGLIDIGELPPSLYATLRDRFGLVPQSALEIYRVGAVAKLDAELLEVAVGSPAFIVQRITSDPHGPYEFTVSKCAGIATRSDPSCVCEKSERLMTMTTLYISRLIKIAEQAAEANVGEFEAASSALAVTLIGDGLINLFGSGHSVLPTQETYPRYGSYIGFNPLTDPRVMWHNVLGPGGVRELLWLERTEGYAEKFLDHQPLNPGDSIVIFGHSGRNASGIDTAIYAKKRQLTVVAITAKANLDKPATHSSGKRLADAADIVIDTGAPIEDAIVPIEGWSRPVAGSSTVLAMMMMHELLARTAQKLSEKSMELPVFASPTIAGVTLHETDLIYGQYHERMIRAQAKHLDFFKERMRGES